MIKKKHIRLLLFNAGILLFSNFLVQLLSSMIVGTIFNGLTGPKAGPIITNVFMRIFLLAVVAFSLYVHTVRDSDSQRAYLEKTLGAEYNRHQEKQDILHNKDYWIEVGIYAILFVARFFMDRVYWLSWIFLLGAVLYVPINLSKHLHIRRKWSEDRLRK